jgi:CRP-like cAMP-binding protein
MDTPPFLGAMEKKAKQLAQSLAIAFQGKGRIQSLTKESELLAVSPSSLIRIINGVFRCQHGEKTIRLYSSGDFLLAPEIGEADGISITSEFGSEIEVVTEADFLNLLTLDKVLLADWLGYQNLETRIGHLLCSLYITDELKVHPEIRQYATGDVIINEEEEPQEIYEMISGSASVSSRGVVLATINAGEVFGELSFFTGLKRTATVAALEPCLLQVIDQTQFLRIMKYRPTLVEGMIRTLCHRLVDLNLRLSPPK